MMGATLLEVALIFMGICVAVCVAVWSVALVLAVVFRVWKWICDRLDAWEDRELERIRKWEKEENKR